MKAKLVLLLALLLCLTSLTFAVAESEHTPVALGDTYTYVDDDEDHGYSLSISLSCVARGEAAKKVVRHWNSANTASIGRGKEWMIVKLHMEALDAKDESIRLKGRYFHFVNASGVEYTRCTLLSNPSEVASFYQGSQQDAWIGCIVDKNDTPQVVYSPDSSTHVWFSTQGRIASAYELKQTLKRGSTDPLVLRVQERLLELGDYEYEPKGTYNSETIAAVRTFQRRMKLKTDGSVNSETAEALFAAE